MDAKAQPRQMQQLLWQCDLHLLAPFAQALTSECDVRLVRTAVTLLRFLCASQQHPLKVRAIADALACDLISCQAWEKRIQNLLASPKWSHHLVQDSLWQQAHELVELAKFTKRDCLVLWDDSVWEKPETLCDPSLGSVRSLQAKRLNRIRPRYYTPPKGVTCVPGLRMSALIVATAKDARIAGCEFFNTREHPRGHAHQVRQQQLSQCVNAWGRQPIHVFDRGYAGWPWLQELLDARVRFTMRWNSAFHIQAEGKVQPVYHSVSGRKRQKLMVWDAHKRKKKARWVIWRQITHPSDSQQRPMWLVVCSDRKRKPWYLLTNQPIESKEQARTAILQYSRRWEVEQQFWRLKHQMQLQTVQLRKPCKRLKLLNLVMLAQNMLMSLAFQKEVVIQLLHDWCPRRGRRMRTQIKVAFERIKTARTKLRLHTERTNQAMWSAAPHGLKLLLGLPP